MSFTLILEPTTVDQPSTTDSTEAVTDESILQKTVIEVNQPVPETVQPETGDVEMAPPDNTDSKTNSDSAKNGEKPEQSKNEDYEVYTKEVVKHRGGTWLRNMEQLPEGWTVINHHCGFPLFFQKETRVVTWSRPYYIGNSSVKNHKVPMTAIPCLAYSRRNQD